MLSVYQKQFAPVLLQWTSRQSSRSWCYSVQRSSLHHTKAEWSRRVLCQRVTRNQISFTTNPLMSACSRHRGEQSRQTDTPITFWCGQTRKWKLLYNDLYIDMQSWKAVRTAHFDSITVRHQAGDITPKPAGSSAEFLGAHHDLLTWKYKNEFNTFLSDRFHKQQKIRTFSAVAKFMQRSVSNLSKQIDYKMTIL